MLFFFQRERERVQIAGLGCRSLGRGRVRSLVEGAGEGGGGEEGAGGGVGEGRPSSASSIHTRLPIWSGAPRGDFFPLSKQHSCGVSTPGSDRTRHYSLWGCLWMHLSPPHFLLSVSICTLRNNCQDYQNHFHCHQISAKRFHELCSHQDLSPKNSLIIKVSNTLL